MVHPSLEQLECFSESDSPPSKTCGDNCDVASNLTLHRRHVTNFCGILEPKLTAEQACNLASGHEDGTKKS